MNRTGKIAVIIATLACVLALASCGGNSAVENAVKKAVSDSVDMQTVGIPEAGFSIDVPSLWIDNPDGDPATQPISMMAPSGRAAIVVVRESVSDFAAGTSLSDYLTLAVTGMKSADAASNVESGEIQAATIGVDNIPAQQQYLNMDVQGTTLRFLVTTVGDETSFFQIVLDTAKNDFSNVEDLFNKMLASVKIESPAPSAAGDFAKPAQEELTLKVVSSQGSGLSIMLPESWQAIDAGNPDVCISYIASDSVTQVIAVEEPAMDFASSTDINKYAGLVIDQMHSNQQAGDPNVDWTTGELQDVTVGEGIPAVQQVVDTPMQGVNIRYLYTFCKTDDYYYQIIFATVPSSYDAQKPLFDEILKSVRFDG